jgi:hypothetical protein
MSIQRILGLLRRQWW